VSYSPEEIEAALTDAKALLHHRHGDNRRELVEIIEQLRAEVRHMDSERALAKGVAQHWSTRAIREDIRAILDGQA
jgi:nitrate reductase assembly molybdenum cofactor insertion protein NarJ